MCFETTNMFFETVILSSHSPVKPCCAYFLIRDTIMTTIHVCRRKHSAALNFSSTRSTWDTSIFGKYASRPTACLLSQFVFMTCKVIGHADLAAKPVSPPSHDKFMSAGRGMGNAMSQRGQWDSHSHQDDGTGNSPSSVVV